MGPNIDTLRTVSGYLAQSDLVTDYLENVIDDLMKNGESAIIEGVHLSPHFILKMQNKYPSCIPFLLYIKRKATHKKRFASRSKSMSLEADKNDYIKHFFHIRTIQKYMKSRCKDFLVPRINNVNAKSCAAIASSIILRCTKHIFNKVPIFDVNSQLAIELNNIYFNIISNVSKKKNLKFSSTEDFLRKIKELYF